MCTKRKKVIHPNGVFEITELTETRTEPCYMCKGRGVNGYPSSHCVPCNGEGYITSEWIVGYENE